MEFKVCTICNEKKGINDFYFNKRCDKHQSQCKKCNNKRARERENANSEKYLKRRKLYNDNNKVERLDYIKKYKRENKDKVLIWEQRRRSRKKLLETKLTSKKWEKCKNSFDNKCAYCGSDERKLTQEHFIPISKNGEYTINNIIPACCNCNSSKRDTDFWEWYYKQSFYSMKRERKLLNYLGYKERIQQLKLI